LIETIKKFARIMQVNVDGLGRAEEKQPKSILDDMDEGVFYSLGEMFEKILGKKAPIFSTKEDLETYLREEGVSIEDSKVSAGDLISPIASLFSNTAYVFSMLSTYVTKREIVVVFKEGVPYYSKKAKF
jgi:hypothetical protein